MSLKIITLNVQGFRSIKKQTQVMYWARSQRCDLLLLQETNFRNCSDVVMFRSRFNVEGYFSFGYAKCEGVGMVNLCPSVVREVVVKYDMNGRVIVCDISVFGSRIRVINVYAPARAGACNPFFEI